MVALILTGESCVIVYNTRLHYISKLTGFKNETIRIDVDAIVQKALV